MLADAARLFLYRDRFGEDELGVAMGLLGYARSEPSGALGVEHVHTALDDPPPRPEGNVGDDDADEQRTDGWAEEDLEFDDDSASGDEAAASAQPATGPRRRPNEKGPKVGDTRPALRKAPAPSVKVIAHVLEPEDPVTMPTFRRVPLPIQRRRPKPIPSTTEAWRAAASIGIDEWRSGGDDLDVDRCVDMLATLEPIDEFPRLVATGSPRRIAILRDLGSIVGPLGAPIRELGDSISAHLPALTCEYLAFCDDPMHGCGAGPISTWEVPTRRTFAGVLLVVAIDGRERDLARWRGFWELLDPAAVHVVFLGAPATIPGLPADVPWSRIDQ